MRVISPEKQQKIIEFVAQNEGLFTAPKLAERFRVQKRTMYRFCAIKSLPIKHYEKQVEAHKRRKEKVVDMNKEYYRFDGLKTII